MWERLTFNFLKKFNDRLPESQNTPAMKSRLQSIIGDEVSQFLETNNLTDKTLKQLELQITRLVSQEGLIASIETPKQPAIMSSLKKSDLDEFNNTLPDINVRASLTNVGGTIK
jgi:hypothetical protein